MFINQANKAAPHHLGFARSRTRRTLSDTALRLWFPKQRRPGRGGEGDSRRDISRHYRLAARLRPSDPISRAWCRTTVHLAEKSEIFSSSGRPGAAWRAGRQSDVQPRSVGGEKFTGSGLAAQWAEIEGPLVETWPPASVQRVFGALPVRPLAEDGQRWPGSRLRGGGGHIHRRRRPTRPSRRLPNALSAGHPERMDIARYTQLGPRGTGETEPAGRKSAVRRSP